MDEAVRVYLPKKQLTVDRILEEWDEIREPKTSDEVFEENNRRIIPSLQKIVAEEEQKKGKWESRLNTLREVLAEQHEKEMKLRRRHPGFDLIYNWILALIIASLLIGSIWAWGSDHKMKKEESIRTTAYAEGQADLIDEQRAAAEAEANSEAAYRKSIEDLKTADIQRMAKLLDGIEGFKTNPQYAYTSIDVETYGQCPINRVLDNTEFSWCTTLEEAIMQENQWVGMSVNNEITDQNLKIAKKLVNRLYGVLYPDLYPDADPMPCSSKYCWTEFTKDGLWLKSTVGTATFNNTWRAA